MSKQKIEKGKTYTFKFPAGGSSDQAMLVPQGIVDSLNGLKCIVLDKTGLYHYITYFELEGCTITLSGVNEMYLYE